MKHCETFIVSRKLPLKIANQLAKERAIKSRMRLGGRYLPKWGNYDDQNRLLLHKENYYYEMVLVEHKES